jgi:hypothetical protein
MSLEAQPKDLKLLSGEAFFGSTERYAVSHSLPLQEADQLATQSSCNLDGRQQGQRLTHSRATTPNHKSVSRSRIEGVVDEKIRSMPTISKTSSLDRVDLYSDKQ